MRLLMKQGLAGVGLVGMSLLSTAALAQEPAAKATTEALSLAAQETSVPGGTLMLIAYLALWLMVFAYIAMIMRRQSALNRDLAALERRMDEAFGGQDD